MINSRIWMLIFFLISGTLSIFAQDHRNGSVTQTLKNKISLPDLNKYKSAKMQIKYGSNLYDLKEMKTVTGKNVLSVQYTCPQLPSLNVNVNLRSEYVENHRLITHDISVTSKEKLAENLTMYFPVHSVQAVKGAWYPLKSGIGKHSANASDNISAVYKCAGAFVQLENDLALPLVVGNVEKNKVAVMTDPYFSSMYDDQSIYWTYPKEVGLEDAVEKRTIVEALDITDPDDAINIFYKSILKDIPAGPSWMKDIAMISYDYLSDDGKGWFNDIDSLVKVIPETDRHKVLLTLHGWYDYIGRYCFDPKTKKLDTAWYTRLTKQKITLNNIHHRIKYAKDRGFKVAIYFADGICSDDQLEDYSPEKSIGRSAWQGPDVVGKLYVRDIAYPEYYQWYVDYAATLFNEYARDADMFVWDETYFVKAGRLSTGKYKSYLDRKFMRLVKDITTELHKVNPNAAFMTSDLIGPDGTGYGGPGNDFYSEVPPYALVADGNYQDSNCQPMFWSWGIFPSYRNVVWSCNWTPVTRFDLTLFGALHYQSPVIFTNGWGDDIGFSELNEIEKANLIKLFNYRKSFRTNLKWLEVLPPFINTCKMPRQK